MRRTKEEAENTREDILNAAVKVFCKQGVAKSTLETIAKEANVTRGAIYWHFKNKVEIFDALHERLHRPFIDMIMEDMEKDHPEPITQLHDLCVKLLVELEDNDQKRQALELFLIKCDYTGELEVFKEQHQGKKDESMKLFQKYFEKAKKAGKLPTDSQPALLARSISCFLKGILFEYLNNPEDFQMKKQGPALMDLFFQNIIYKEK